MIAMRVTLIGIPRQIWETIPTIRSLAAIAGDARGAKRRYFKGVNRHLEKKRYRQLCAYIESTAIDLLLASKLGNSEREFANRPLRDLRVIAFDDFEARPEASVYLRIIELLSSGEDAECHQVANQPFLDSGVHLKELTQKFSTLSLNPECLNQDQFLLQHAHLTMNTISQARAFVEAAWESEHAVVTVISHVPT